MPTSNRQDTRHASRPGNQVRRRVKGLTSCPSKAKQWKNVPSRACARRDSGCWTSRRFWQDDIHLQTNYSCLSVNSPTNWVDFFSRTTSRSFNATQNIVTPGMACKEKTMIDV